MDLGGLLTAKPNAPLSTAGAVAAVFLAPVILLFIAAPTVFARLETTKLILVAASIGYAVFALSATLAFVVLLFVEEWGKTHRDAMTASETVAYMSAENPLEWPALWAGAGLANGIFFVLSTLAYFRPLNLGRVLLITAWLLLAAIGIAAIVGGLVVGRRRWLQLLTSTPTKPSSGRGAGLRG